MKLFVGCFCLMALGTQAQRWPIKTIDLSDGGANCDTDTEQYLQVEGYDYHDHPKFIMRWRQITGPCGAALPESELLFEETFYDSTAGDSPPNTSAGRVQLNLFLCCPFGDYELDLIVESFSDEGSDLEQRTSWEIENGPDEFHIWDTVNTNLADDEAYSPTVPGTYTWPLVGETGYYKTLYAGPLPPLECSPTAPPGTESAGCFEDSSNNRLLDSDSMTLEEMGPSGMTNQICSDFCSDYEFFGLESGSQCYCGTAGEFQGAVSSDDCGTNFAHLCTGDSTTACGGDGAINVFQRTGDAGPSPTPDPVDPTPSPVSVIPTLAPVQEMSATPAPVQEMSATPAPFEEEPAPTPDSFSVVGCFADSKANRVMVREPTSMAMSAEVCFALCNDGANTHFSTQFASECWCAINPDLTTNGEELDFDECDMDCTGSSTGEKCGGSNKLTAYVMEDGGSAPAPTPEPEPAPTDEEEVPTEGGAFVGCFEDSQASRALNLEGKNAFGDMTNEACIEFCAEAGHPYAGTQYSTECWCGVTFDLNGEAADPADRCSFPCEGDSSQICGGNNSLSVYTTGI